MNSFNMRKRSGSQLTTKSDTVARLKEDAVHSSVVDLTNALVDCDEHLGEIQDENQRLRVRNAELEGDSTPVAPGLATAGLTQALDHCGDELANAQLRNQELIDSNVSLLGLVRERSEAMEEAQHAADHDLVTELPNRRLLPKRMRRAMEQARKEDQCLAIVMLDLDGFKQVNDRLGHPAGDRLLQALARRISTNVSGVDSVCRYGGVQFLLILPDMGESAALNLVERIAHEVSAPWIVDGFTVRLTITAGVALYPRDGRDIAKLLQTADRAMCLQKPKPDHEASMSPAAVHGAVPAS